MFLNVFCLFSNVLFPVRKCHSDLHVEFRCAQLQYSIALRIFSIAKDFKMSILNYFSSSKPPSEIISEVEDITSREKRGGYTTVDNVRRK